MPKPAKAAHTGKAKSRDQHSVGKLQLYEILYTLNHGFEQVLGQLQLLEKLGVMVDENRAEVNFELVERLAEREERDWTYFARLRDEREKRLRDPQDVLIEADGLRQELKKCPHSDAELRNNSPLAPCLARGQSVRRNGKQNLYRLAD